MSLSAFDSVARSRRGNYFLFGPLVRKSREGGRGGGLMDLYATLSSSYMMLPRGPARRKMQRESSTGLSRSGMLWSRVYKGAGLDRGAAPMPILTAARVVTDEEDHATDVEVPQGRPPEAQIDLPFGKLRTQAHWWEMTPLEVGSADVRRHTDDSEVDVHSKGAYIPTWSFGRPFNAGISEPYAATPELCLSLLLGHCTSAPAGPLTGYISALLSTLPRDTIMSWVLTNVNKFLLWKTWRRRWANPIRSSKEWNPFRGMRVNGATAAGINCETAQEEGMHAQQHAVQHRSMSSDTVSKVKLMDAGISNNLPAHVFAGHPNREVDVFVGFDASSDVQTLSSLQRVQDFARERGLRFRFAEESEDLVLRWKREVPESEQADRELTSFLGDAEEMERSRSRLASTDDHTSAKGIYKRFASQYCIVLDGYKERRPNETTSQPASSQQQQPDFIYIYVPLLPSPLHPAFDPAKSDFSTSYNLLWTKAEAQTIFRTVKANVLEGVVGEEVRRKMWSVVRRATKARLESRRHRKDTM
ncbi:unnamed protein product [Jaminaea pallidilutea]